PQTRVGSDLLRDQLGLEEAIGARERHRLEPGLDSGSEYALDGTHRQTAIVHMVRIEAHGMAVHVHDFDAYFDGANDLRDVGDGLTVPVAVEEDAPLIDAEP